MYCITGLLYGFEYRLSGPISNDRISLDLNQHFRENKRADFHQSASRSYLTEHFPMRASNLLSRRYVGDIYTGANDILQTGTGPTKDMSIRFRIFIACR